MEYKLARCITETEAGPASHVGVFISFELKWRGQEYLGYSFISLLCMYNINQ